MVELRVHCMGEAACRFTGTTLEFELELLNSGSTALQLPLNYLQKRGPAVRIHDNHSGKVTSLRRPLAAAALREQVTELAPGQSVRITYTVRPEGISRFALRPVDVFFEFSFNLAPAEGEPQMVNTRVRVTGAEGLD